MVLFFENMISLYQTTACRRNIQCNSSKIQTDSAGKKHLVITDGTKGSSNFCRIWVVIKTGANRQQIIELILSTKMNSEKISKIIRGEPFKMC